MIRNREVKGFLDRGPARAVAVSPLSRNTLGQGAIQFAALEVAKAIATGFANRVERSHRQPRFPGLDHRETLRGAASAMPNLRQQESCGTRAGRLPRSSLAPAPSW